MVQPSQLIWIAVALALLLLGLSLGNVVLLTGAVFVLLTALLTTALAAPSGVVVDRELSRASCWVGDTLSVRREVTAQGGIGPVFVHDELPPEAEVVDGNNLRVVLEVARQARRRHLIPDAVSQARPLRPARVSMGVNNRFWRRSRSVRCQRAHV